VAAKLYKRYISYERHWLWPVAIGMGMGLGLDWALGWLVGWIDNGRGIHRGG